MNDTELTPRQRAEATRQRNAAARKAHREQRDQQEREDKMRVARCMRKILDDPDSTANQMIFAALTLHDLSWTFPLPSGAKKIFEGEVDKSAFAHAVEMLAQDYQTAPDANQGEE